MRLINICMSVKEYNLAQMEEMKKHRWIESQKQGCDLGEDAYIDWIKNHAQKFRQEWKEKNL